MQTTNSRIEPSGFAERDGSIEACRRLETMISIVAAQPGAYPTIGPHVRHCLDHYRCFFDGLRSGVVDYDTRAREPRVELDAVQGLEVLRSVIDQLGALDPQIQTQLLQVRQTPAPGVAPAQAASSVGRELSFLSGHTIHHLAILATLAGSRGASIPESLTIAYSTEAHRQAVPIE